MKTNSESLDAESATVPTTKHESDDLNMSAGAEMLIERMKTNPDDFKYSGKFYRVVQAINDGQQWVSKRDREALRRAYDTEIVEADFSEWVYNEIFNPKEPEPVQNLYAQMQGQRAQMQNAMQNSLLQGTGVYNPMMTMSSNGNLGIGTSTGHNSLAVGAAGSTTALTVAGTSGQQLMAVNANSGNPAMTLGQTTLTESMLGQIKSKLGL